MALSITTLADAFRVNLDRAVTVAVKVIEIGDMIEYKTTDKETMRYRIVRVADETANLQMRIYSKKSSIWFRQANVICSVSW